MKTGIRILMTGAAMLMAADAAAKTGATPPPAISPASGESAFSEMPEGAAGDFLSSYHAQMIYDWTAAKTYIDRVLEHDPGNADLIKRAMILSMGTGDLAGATARAQQLLGMSEKSGEESLALMIVTTDQIQKGDLQAAVTTLDSMTPGDMTDFVKPLMHGWIMAGQGKFDPTGLNDTSIHLFHGGLMALATGNKSKAKELAGKLGQLEGLNALEAVRAADLLAALGDKEKALQLYESVQAEQPDKDLDDRMRVVRDGGDLASVIPALSIKTAAQGVALTMYDVAQILYTEQTDSSTKLFAQMALALDPDMTEARLLLGDTLARNGRLQEAIDYFRAIPETHKSYLPAQRYAAELLAEAGKSEEARALLNDLFVKHNDVESLIRIGDLYRTVENYGEALNAYNRAASVIGKTIPEEYWHLLYARGMAYERQGQWAQAEADLKAALGFRPNHPYLLNYLGYGWADQGVNLDKSLELLERAAALRPADGYITDSLGWVHFMMGHYKEAVPSLERAVELLPYDPTINDHLGDVYWMVGRKREARFQWERAMSHAQTPQEKEKLAEKLKSGITHQPLTQKQASSTADTAPAATSQH